MKKIITLLISFFILISFWFLNQTSASIFWSSNTEIKYCDSWECSLEQWVEYASWVEWVVTSWTASAYIQKIVVYVLSFLKLLAVLIIIYAWFNMLTAAWDEDKAKKSKTIIVFAIIWLLIIFLAWPITTFVIDVLTWATPTTPTNP